MPTIIIDLDQVCRKSDDAIAKVNRLESDIHAIVEAIAALSVGRRGDIKSLYEFTALSHPELWLRFNGNKGYQSSAQETSMNTGRAPSTFRPGGRGCPTASRHAARLAPEPDQVCSYSGARCNCGTAPCPNRPVMAWHEIQRVKIWVPLTTRSSHDQI